MYVATVVSPGDGALFKRRKRNVHAANVYIYRYIAEWNTECVDASIFYKWWLPYIVCMANCAWIITNLTHKTYDEHVHVKYICVEGFGFYISEKQVSTYCDPVTTTTRGATNNKKVVIMKTLFWYVHIICIFYVSSAMCILQSRHHILASMGRNIYSMIMLMKLNIVWLRDHFTWWFKSKYI